LARTLAEQIEKLLPQTASSTNPPWPSVADCARRLGRTEHDLQPALVDILARLTDPPFATQLNHDEQVQYLTRLGRKSASVANLSDSLQAAHAALDASPGDAQLCAHMAELEQAAGHEPEAEAAGLHAVDLLPSSEEAWSQLGSTYVQEKKYEDAVNAYQRAFDLDTRNVWPLQNLATAHAKLGRTREAMAEYQRALAISPRFGLAWIGLGQLIETTGRKEEATNCYHKALQYPIHRAPELTTLARFCLSRGWYDAASTNYNEAVALDPSDPALSREAGNAHYLFGVELGNSGKAALAAREFREVLRLMPELTEARLNLGIALYQDGQWNASQTEFEQVAARNPTNTLAQHYLELLHNRPASPEKQ